MSEWYRPYPPLPSRAVPSAAASPSVSSAVGEGGGGQARPPLPPPADQHQQQHQQPHNAKQETPCEQAGKAQGGKKEGKRGGAGGGGGKKKKNKGEEAAEEERCPVFDDDVRFVDVGANLTDPMFQGTYNDKPYHAPDLPAVLSRAHAAGVHHIVVTAGCLRDVDEALALCRDPANAAGGVRLVCTVGVHPTRCLEFEQDPEGADAHLRKLAGKIEANKDVVVAVGECGLDFDREQFCPRDVQLRYFERQLELAKATNLPLFLHNRNTGGEFARVLGRHIAQLPAGGVVHSFTGDLAELHDVLALGVCVGLNGCSLKSAHGLEVARALPLDRLMLETDAPWCDIRPTSHAFEFVHSKWPARKKDKFEEGACVKNRQEPCHIRQVAEAIAGARQQPVAVVAAAAFRNSARVFFKGRI